jgi:putative ABC transport system permease protein
MTNPRDDDHRLDDLRSRPSVDDEVRSELDFHLEMVTRELIESGMRPDAARAEAMQRFGDRAAVDDACRRLGRQRERHRARAEYLLELKRDVQFALRQLARARGFTFVAIVTLALGIGATAAVFSVLRAVALRPLPYAEPDRIVSINGRSIDGSASSAGGAEFAAWSARTEAFEHTAAAILGAGFTLTNRDVPEIRAGGYVSWQFFRVFGVAPMRGRDFMPDDDRPGAAPVVLISERLWTERYASDPSLVGRTIAVDGVPRTVIGIIPRYFDLTGDSEDMWIPLALTGEQLANANSRFIRVFARLRAGVSLQQAQDIAEREERALAARTAAANITDAVVKPYTDEVVGDYRGRMLVLLGAVLFVLLIGCVNVANLLLARGALRARELAIRAALGAARDRLLRQLLAESLVLALAGALIGIALAFALVPAMIAIAPSGVPRLGDTRIDATVLAFALGVALVSSVLFGLFPAVRATRPELQQMLREGGRGASSGRDRVRSVLVAAEVALALTLLAGSGLLVRSAMLLSRVDPGFNPENVLTARIVLPAASYSDSTRIVDAYRRIREEASRIPGVESAALVGVVPLSGSSMQAGVSPEGRALTSKERLASNLRMASTGYFATMRIPILEGRDLTERDDASAPRVALINQAMAKRLWPGESAIGKRFRGLGVDRSHNPVYIEVIGVVGNLHDASLATDVVPEFYLPYQQTPGALWNALQRSLVVVIRTKSDPEGFVRPLREAVARVDRSLPLADSNTMTALLARSLAASRLNMALLTSLGVLAFVLAAIGVYGIVSYFVSQRTREIGVRIALGATARQVWTLVVGRGMAPIVAGAILGLAGAIAGGSVLRSQLYGVTTTDPLTLAAAVLVLLLSALAATYVPARRAMRVDPTVALGAE